MSQWKVYVVDNKNRHVGPFIVAATGERQALAKGKDYYNRQAAKGDFAVAAVATSERDSDGNA